MIGSNVSRVGLKNGSVYAATKAAVANLVRSVALEEGSYNTLINTVSPGPVETVNNDFDPAYCEFRRDYFANQLKLTSLGRLATVDDVCQTIIFLTSMANSHITGEEIFITGGAI
jgi:NAD(P)-dependent dehydrogenase (short-subunit alcohol dehydrogenase family)